ncbi:MAG TPA: O-antigen translocase [Ideonella sp.]|nr:O-antigen translocase [Ideonella sp.]
MTDSRVTSELAAALGSASGEPLHEAAEEQKGYRQILKSSAMIAGSSVLTIGISIVRAKIVATLLGPAGVGLLGLYSAIADLARSGAEMGINGSAVRQIAQSAESGDDRKIAMTLLAVRRLALILGILGGLALAALSVPVSRMTFGDELHSGAIALLGLAVLLRLVSDAQGALLQGTRRIADLARMTVWGGLLGSLAMIALVVLLAERGLALSLVAVAGTSLAVSWWYARKLKAPVGTVSGWSALRSQALPMLQLGVAFMLSGLLMMGAAYAVRSIVVRELGLAEAGLFQSAWAMGGLYVGIVLQAMATDFYPRLVGAANDDTVSNLLVNQQSTVSLLLAGPGVLATLALAPWVLALFYSSAFVGAVDVLRWLCLGMALRVVTWPLGYVLVARAQQRMFIATELLWATVNVTLSVACVRSFGLAGAGLAFFITYALHAVLIYVLLRRLTGFRYSAQNRKACALFLSSIGIVFAGLQLLPAGAGLGLAVLATLWSAAYSLRGILKLVPEEQLPPRLRRLVAALADFAKRRQSAGRLRELNRGPDGQP